MGKQPTLAEVRERCHALGIQPGRSVAECLRRIDAAISQDEHAWRTSYGRGAFMRRVRRVELMTRSLTGYVTVARHLATVRR